MKKNAVLQILHSGISHPGRIQTPDGMEKSPSGGGRLPAGISNALPMARNGAWPAV